MWRWAEVFVVLAVKFGTYEWGPFQRGCVWGIREVVRLWESVAPNTDSVARSVADEAGGGGVGVVAEGGVEVRCV